MALILLVQADLVDVLQPSEERNTTGWNAEILPGNSSPDHGAIDFFDHRPSALIPLALFQHFNIPAFQDEPSHLATPRFHPRGECRVWGISLDQIDDVVIILVMTTPILVAGLLLITTGVGFFLATGATAMTSLIPAFLGAPLAICGVLMLAIPGPGRRHIAHVAAIFALLGVLGGLGMGIPGLIKILNHAETARPLAVTLQLIMGVICAILMTLMVRSFIQARRARTAPPA